MTDFHLSRDIENRKRCDLPAFVLLLVGRKEKYKAAKKRPIEIILLPRTDFKAP
ncbi:hypothetical protein DESC_370043 [Desulfosarcina cetonica]|nr:hypothetical protein DESC_370043 [Desulfosarcina cetonica]